VGHTLEINAEFPPILAELFQPHRYKVLWGGRAGMKSWSIARAIVLRMAQQPTRVLCVREQMNSIKDSVHKLLCDQIEALGLSSLFEIQQASIKVVTGPGIGSEASFEGIRHNVSKIKSYEGIDICWVEEAVNVSKNSWQVLIPTIRKEGSEIWVSFNPELETDDTYVRFVKHPPPDAWVQKVGYQDNPWLPSEIRADIEHLKLVDYDTYVHVYEGGCKATLEGAVYAEELRAALSQNRICNVPYDPLLGVSLVFDLGWHDATAIWFVQRTQFEIRFIHYYESTRTTIEKDLQYCQGLGYTIDTVWLPHDARAKSKATGRSIEDIVRSKGFKVRIVPKLSLADGINAARTIFSSCYFDQVACEEGIQALRHYRYELIEDPVKKIFTREPVHDWTSHGSDAFRYAAIAIRQPSNLVSRVDAALAAAREAEDALMARLGRYSFGGGSPTSWMK
jgi:phage terminase large subunit